MKSLSVVSALFVSLCAASSHASDDCAPSPLAPSVEAAESLPYDAALAALEKLNAQAPGDLTVQESYFSKRSERDYPGALQTCRERIAADTNSPMQALLEAKLIGQAKAEDEIAALEKLIAAHPDYAPAHLQLATSYAAAKNVPGAQRELAAYFMSCPKSLSGYSLIANSLPAAEAKKKMGALRELLAAQTDDAALRTYRTLWNWEFKSASPEEQPAVRARIARDLQQIRQSVAAPSSALLFTLENGYKTTGDAAGLEWVAAQRAARFNGDQGAIMHELMRFEMAQDLGKSPTAQAREAARAAWWEAGLDWTKRSPEFSPGWSALLENLPEGATPEEVSALGKRAQVYAPLDVAALYAARAVNVKEVPELINSALDKEARILANQRLQPARYGAELAFREQMGAGKFSWQVQSTLARAYALLGDLKGMRSVAAAMEEALTQELKEKEKLTTASGEHAADYWHARAYLAQAGQKPADAVVYFLRADKADPTDDSGPTAPILEARAQWTAMGGTDEGWKFFSREEKAPAPAPAVSVWEEKAAPLAPFVLKDIAGHTWSSKALHGKTVLISVWATWCEPCLAEMPLLDQLYRQMNGRRDVVVLSLNVDKEAALVAPFINGNKYGFPAILAGDYAESIAGTGIPATLIVDRNGTIQLRRAGFGGSGEEWLADARSAIDRVAKMAR